MKALTRPARWSMAVVALHWLGATLTVELLAHGWVMVHGNLSAATAFGLYQSHKSLGFAVLVLTLVRLTVRFSGEAPSLPPGPAWESRLAGAVQATLYALTVVAAFSGWLLVSTSPLPIPTHFFGLFVIPDIAGRDAALFAAATRAHQIAVWSVAGLVGLHVAGALKHHVVDGDNVLKRMLPRRPERASRKEPTALRRGRVRRPS